MTRGSQGPPAPTTNNPVMKNYMMNVDAHLSTKNHDYGMLEYVEKGKEATNPLTPLQIQKAVGKTMTRIPKGEFKKASHSPNARASHNYFVMENLA
jgi:hypothetical protein